MSMRVSKVLGAIFVLCCSLAQADEAMLARFFPSEKKHPRYVQRPITSLPRVDSSESPVDQYNAAVELNNRALDAMNKNDFETAVRLLASACQKAPSGKGFWSNYLIALRRSKGRAREAIDVARTVMALDAGDSQAPYIAGLIYLNDLKEPSTASDYLSLAHQLAPEDNSIAVALATALDQAGFADDAFEMLKKYALKADNDSYPFYLLGLQYLERKDYNPAIRAFETARAFDDKGYAHDAWVRSRYFAGQLEGLAPECKAILQRFPDVLNRDSLEKILLSLQPGDFKLIETIGLKISTPSALEKLDFLIRPIPDVADHQRAELVKVEFVSRGRSIEATLEKTAANKLRIPLDRSILAPELQLRMTYRINTTPLLGSRMPNTAAVSPDIRALSNDPLLSMNHPLLAALSTRIAALPGNYVQNATIAVATGLKYRENFEDHPVEWALANLDACDCTEYSRLLTALCLKKGIPARMATGFLVKTELIGKETAVGHAWCEVFFKGKGWVPIDPTLQTNMHWAYFGNLLSDQILFDYIGAEKRSRVSIDFSSTRPDLKVNLSNSYLINRW